MGTPRSWGGLCRAHQCHSPGASTRGVAAGVVAASYAETQRVTRALTPRVSRPHAPLVSLDGKPHVVVAGSPNAHDPRDRRCDLEPPKGMLVADEYAEALVAGADPDPVLVQRFAE